MHRLALALIALPWLAACGPESEPVPAPAFAGSVDSRENVLVIDDGFDPGAPALAGRVAGQYTVVCTGDDRGAIPFGRDGGAPLEPQKAALLAALRTPDTRCRLQPGIEPKPDPLADISTYRPAWNKVIESNSSGDGVFTPAQLMAIRRGQSLARGRYHGTATAGVIAHANPNVRLVLVETRIGGEDDSFGCLDQRELDDVVALFGDPEVQRAYVDRPSALDDDLRALKARHRIGLVNESFGHIGRESIEGFLSAFGCPPVELRPYLALLGRIEEERTRAQAHPETLLVKSAGNEGSVIAGPEDSPQCAAPSGPRLLAGAYDLTGRLADFTNRGPCIDVFAPGVDVVAHLPGGWLMPLDGTSFSAPLLVRLISMDRTSGPFGAAAARLAVLNARDSQRRIAQARFPSEIFYDPAHLIGQWALTVRDRPAQAARPDGRALRELFSLLKLARGGN